MLRWGPTWELTLFGHTIGELFLPAVVIPGAIFTVLARWPYLEARISGHHEWHHFAQRPREAPLRSAIGAAGIAFMTVLMLAGSNDVLATFLHVEVDSLNDVLKVLGIVLPFLVGTVTFRICRDLRDGGSPPAAAPPRATIRRNAEGGFAVDDRPVVEGEPSEERGAR